SKEKIYLHPEAIITNKDITEAKVTDDDRPTLKLRFTAEAAKRLAKATEGHLDKPLAVLIDGKVRLAPVVRAPVSDAASLTGNFEKSDLERIASALKRSLTTRSSR